MASKAYIFCGNCACSPLAVPLDYIEFLLTNGGRDDFKRGMNLLNGNLFLTVCWKESQVKYIKIKAS